MFKYFIIIALVLISTSLFAITPEELARLSEKGAADKRKVDQQLNLDDLHYQLRIDAVEQATTVPEINKHKNDLLKANAAHNQSEKEKDLVAGKIQVKPKRQSTKYSSKREQDERLRQTHPQNNVTPSDRLIITLIKCHYKTKLHTRLQRLKTNM